MGLEVEPAIVIASPMSAMNMPGTQHTAIILRVTKAFIFLLMPVFFQKSSSTVSFAGRTTRGDAVRTAKKRAKFPLRVN